MPRITTNARLQDSWRAIIVPLAARDPATGAWCGASYTPRLTAAQLRAQVFQPAAPGQPSVAGYSACAHGLFEMTQANSRVAEWVQLPCNGSTPSGAQWGTGTCEVRAAGAPPEAAARRR